MVTNFYYCILSICISAYVQNFRCDCHNATLHNIQPVISEKIRT